MSVTTRIIEDRSEKKVHFERVQDVEPILERNKALQGERQARAGTFRHVGTIPNVILEKWMNEEGVPFLSLDAHELKRLIRKKLNDPDWRWLKTTEGRI